MSYEKERIQPCWVCGKVWTRGEVDKWCYFNGMLVCKSHKGALDWYTGALKLADEKTKLLTEPE